MTMFSSYSSLTLQLLQLKSNNNKKISCSHLFSIRICLLYVQPSTLAHRQEKGQTGSVLPEHFVTLYWEGPTKNPSSLPSHKANQHEGSIIQTHGHGQNVLSKPFHLFGFLINSKYCFYVSCIVPKRGAFLKRLQHMQHAQCTAIYFHST